MFQRIFGQADRVRKPDLRWDTALRNLQIQLELRITRVRPPYPVRLLEDGFGSGRDLDSLKSSQAIRTNQDE
jgi:hypothetical protein